jgi:hypothetical protein
VLVLPFGDPGAARGNGLGLDPALHFFREAIRCAGQGAGWIGCRRTMAEAHPAPILVEEKKTSRIVSLRVRD